MNLAGYVRSALVLLYELSIKYPTSLPSRCASASEAALPFHVNVVDDIRTIEQAIDEAYAVMHVATTNQKLEYLANQQLSRFATERLEYCLKIAFQHFAPATESKLKPKIIFLRCQVCEKQSLASNLETGDVRCINGC